MESKIHTLTTFYNFVRKYDVKLVHDYTSEPLLILEEDNSITIHGDFVLNYIYFSPIKKLPFKLNKVYGSFILINAGLKSLDGCPKYVCHDFNVSQNQLSTLDGGPVFVGENYNVCQEYELENIDGIADYIGQDLLIKNVSYDMKKINKNIIMGGYVQVYSNCSFLTRFRENFIFYANKHLIWAKWREYDEIN